MRKIIENSEINEPHIYDIIKKIKKNGNKKLVDALTKIAIDKFRLAFVPSKENDIDFLTPPLKGDYSVGVKAYSLEGTNSTEKLQEKKHQEI